MSDVSYQILARRQKSHIRAYIFLCLILVVSMGFYSYKKWQEYSLVKQGTEQNKVLVELKRDEVKDEGILYENSKSSFDNLNEEIENKLATIFPSSDNYTALTRQIDTYEQELATKNDPFEIANIDYQNPTTNENYSILPMRMNIRSSADNFTKFLHLVENSGALDSDIRLMDISSIRLDFGEEGESASKEINFSVQINAYFQKP